MPEYFKNHQFITLVIPKLQKECQIEVSGILTAGRMDVYVDEFQKNGGSMIMLAKGNRSKDVTNAWLLNTAVSIWGSIGGIICNFGEKKIFFLWK